MKLKNLMAIAIVSLIAISGMNSASAFNGEYGTPEKGKFIFDLHNSTILGYLNFFDSNHKRLDSLCQLLDSHSSFSYCYDEAVAAGAKYVGIGLTSCGSWTVLVPLYGGCDRGDKITPIYLNFLGNGYNSLPCAVSWYDPKTGKEGEYIKN